VTLARALALLALAAMPALARDPVPLKLKLEISAARGVPELERAAVEGAVVSAVARESSCPVVFARDEETPELLARFHVNSWKGSESPGGDQVFDTEGRYRGREKVFDPKTGTYSPGYRRDIEVGFTLTLLRPGSDKPLREVTRRIRTSAETKAVVSYDPRAAAQSRAFAEVGAEVANAICKAARKLR